MEKQYEGKSEQTEGSVDKEDGSLLTKKDGKSVDEEGGLAEMMLDLPAR